MTDKEPKIITMVCNKGGVGRSTTTINVAWKLAELGYKTLVVDLDAQCNTSMTLSMNYVIDVAKSNMNLLNCIGDERGTFYDYKVNSRHENLDLLGATILLDETEEHIRQFAVGDIGQEDFFKYFIARETKAHGGPHDEMDTQMSMLMIKPAMESDEEMEENYIDFIMDEALDDDEQDFLMNEIRGITTTSGS